MGEQSHSRFWRKDLHFLYHACMFHRHRGLRLAGQFETYAGARKFFQGFVVFTSSVLVLITSNII